MEVTCVDAHDGESGLIDVDELCIELTAVELEKLLAFFERAREDGRDAGLCDIVLDFGEGGLDRLDELEGAR